MSLFGGTLKVGYVKRNVLLGAITFYGGVKMEEQKRFFTPGRVLLIVGATLLGLVLILVMSSCGEKPNAATSGDVSTEPGADVSAQVVNLPLPMWGDSAGGRDAYTQDDIDAGLLGEVPVFNVLSGSPIGDARSFMYAQKIEVDGTFGPAARSLAVTAGERYRVYFYICNDNLGTVATETRAALSVPLASADGEAHLMGTILSEDAVPQEVWSTLVLSSTSEFQISYVYDSARLANSAYPEGLELEDALVTKAASEHGVLIGYERLDGDLPGGGAYEAFVTIDIEIIKAPAPPVPMTQPTE